MRDAMFEVVVTHLCFIYIVDPMTNITDDVYLSLLLTWDAQLNVFNGRLILRLGWISSFINCSKSCPPHYLLSLSLLAATIEFIWNSVVAARKYTREFVSHSQKRRLWEYYFAERATAPRLRFINFHPWIYWKEHINTNFMIFVKQFLLLNFWDYNVFTM